jgi:hypothetical protein
VHAEIYKRGAKHERHGASVTPLSGAGITGIYEFSAQASGRYELTFELVDKDGFVFHTDRDRIDVQLRASKTEMVRYFPFHKIQGCAWVGLGLTHR